MMRDKNQGDRGDQGDQKHNDDSTARRWPALLAALLLYSLLAVAITWPLVLHLDTRLPALPGELGQDVWQNSWNVWWVNYAIMTEHTNPYYTDMLYYPQGASLALHTLNLPVCLIGIPFTSLFGIVVSYNLLTLLILMLAGVGSFLLVRHIVRDDAAALVAGALVMCSPLRLNDVRYALYHTLSDFSFFLALLCVLLLLERRTWRVALLAGASLLLAGLCSWYHLFHLMVVLAVILVWRGVAAWRAGSGPALLHELVAWGRLVAASMLVGLLLLPILAPVITESLASPHAKKSDELVISADLLHLLPSRIGGIWEQVPPDWQYPFNFAVVTLVLALVGFVLAWRNGRRVGMWGAIGVVCLLLSPGPWLIVGGENTGIPMPYALIRAIPVADAMRAPLRINAVTTLVLALFAAHGLALLWRRRALSVRWLLALVVVVVAAGETLRLPFPLVKPSVSPFFERIASEPGEWSIVQLPFNRFDRDVLEMYDQTHHEHAILIGQTSRTVPHVPDERLPPFARVEAADPRPDIVSLAPAERQQLLRGLRLRYLVVRDDPDSPGRDDRQIAVAQQVFGPLTQVYADDVLRAYRFEQTAQWLDNEGRTSYAALPLFLALDWRWEPLEPDGDGLSRWLPPDGAGMWTYTEEPQRVVLELSLYSLPGARPLDIWLNGEHVQTLPIPAGLWVRRYLSAPLDLPAGPSLIELRAPQGGVSPHELGTGEDTRPLSFRVYRARLLPVGP